MLKLSQRGGNIQKGGRAHIFKDLLNKVRSGVKHNESNLKIKESHMQGELNGLVFVQTNFNPILSKTAV